MQGVRRRFAGAVIVVEPRGEGLLSPSALELDEPDPGAAHKPFVDRVGGLLQHAGLIASGSEADHS